MICSGPRRFAALGAVPVLALAGCNIYHPEAYQTVDAGVDAARRDAGFDAGSDAGPECLLTRPPARVPGSGGPGTAHSFALRNLVIYQRDRTWELLGLDIDGVCSHSRATVSCEPNDWASIPLDGAGGVDNAFGARLGNDAIFELVLPQIEAFVQPEQDAGRTALFVHLEGWNGGENDADVTAWLATTAYGESAAGDREMLAWDGTDRFFVSEDDLTEEGDPRVADTNAYVSDYTLVMELPDEVSLTIPWVTFSMSMPPLPVHLDVQFSDARLLMTLSEDGRTVTGARLVGRWALADLDSVFERMGLCTAPERNLLRSSLESALDVTSNPDLDWQVEGDPRAPCDALSFAFAMDGSAAQLGGRAALPEVMDLCEMP